VAIIHLLEYPAAEYLFGIFEVEPAFANVHERFEGS
jgi:hypothetical protein